MIDAEVIIIGGGPAGLAAAESAANAGASVLILERDNTLGGILNQCIHNGFGLHYFKEELTGPEYAERFIKLVEKTDVRVQTDTMVLEVTADKKVHCVSAQHGYQILTAGAIVLCMGCRERTAGAISVPGTRPAGVFTAGAAQRYVNIEGYMVGKRVVILGSGDIGLIMARRMTLEGAKVLACVELMPYSGGLTRNIVQCLDDFDIPLYLAHTITKLEGTERLERVTVQKVDENRMPIAGTEMIFDCDTLLLSVGLIPENELSKTAGIALNPRTNGPLVYENMQTSIEGIFACGNVLHVHDLVDFVTAESKRAGAAAAEYVQRKTAQPSASKMLNVNAQTPVTYTVPSQIRLEGIGKTAEIFFRVNRVCGESIITVKSGEMQIAAFKRERLAPGEMEHITVPRILLEKANGEITLGVQEVQI